MVREIHAKDFNSLSKKDRYYLEKALKNAIVKRTEVVRDKERCAYRVDRSTTIPKEYRRESKIRPYIIALVVQAGNRPAISGSNSYTKTHPKQKRYAVATGQTCERSFIHAEIHAISRADQPVAIYIARSDGQGNPKLAKPCPACRRAIEDSGIRRIVHT